MELFYHYLRLPYLLQGIVFTIEVTALGLAGGLGLGVLLAGMQLSRFRVLAGLARLYTVIFRGTPLILQLVFVYDALPHIGIKLTAMAAAGVALALNEAPFIAEILRSGVLGVDRGQVMAGQALGMTPGVLMRRVIAPQALRSMVPAFGNETVSTLKNSSLASVISVQELTLRSTQLASSTFDFFSIFFASGLIYLGLTGAVAASQLLAERWLDLDRPVKAGPVRVAVPEPPQPPLRTGWPIMQVQALQKSYGSTPVLRGIDLTVRAGEVVALLGPSGSGKSTLLRCLNRLEAWEAGDVLIAGQRLTDASPRAMAQARAEAGIGMVFQQFNLFSHLTARENVAGPLRWVQGLSANAAGGRADALLDRVGLLDRADALPRHLSGGQQQRVAIARALAAHPTVLLLDEPTSALDPELVREVLEVIRGLAGGGLTMLISTHQLRFAREVADRVVFLHGGSIIEEGPAEQVLTRPRHALTARFLDVMGVNQESPA